MDKGTLHGARIIIIDDHRDLADNLSELLADEGASVRIAADASTGIALAKAGCDVALVDVRLPDAIGLSLVPVLREIDANTAVVLITGHASIDDAIAAVRAGAYAYVLKPFDTPELLTTVARAVERVRLERHADALTHALERREAELRTMVEAVAALLLVLDERGLVVQANPAVAAATGVPIHELIGLDWAERFVPEADRAELTSAFAKTRGGRAGMALEGRVLCRRENQVEERVIRWRLAGLPGPEGFRIYASGLDVTDVRVLERRTRLAEKLAAVGTFSAGLAHEIRNPLNGATLQLQLLERRLAKIVEPERAAPVREPLALVRAELERLSRLVTEFLAFARPAALQARDTDLVATAAQVVELETPVAAQRHRVLELRAEDGPVIVEIDPERIKQILLNLVRNALDAATQRVVVRVRRDGAGACLCVTDDGPGISAENRARIFEPFFTTKEGGTGLGMAIVHSLVERHGGTIEIHCDHGTTVSISLQRRVP